VSNHLAIATVTYVLARVVDAAAEAAVSGADVTTQRPDASDDNTAPHVNLYLYQVGANAAWRNDDLPTRGSDGGLARRPQAALDLHYLLTFYGDEGRLEPQRLLGSVATALHAGPVLTRERIRRVIQTILDTDPEHFLAGSDLADQVDLVRFSPLPLNLEELSKLWSVFFQTPYALSVAYQGSVVLLEADGSPRQAAPVREHNVHVEPMRRPVIEELLSRSGPGETASAERPVLSSDELVIEGRELRGEHTRVLVGGIEVTSFQEASNTRIVLPVPAGLQAGTRAVRVAHSAMMGTPPSPRPGVESNTKTFQLRPRIVEPVEVAEVGDGTEITTQLSPEIGKTQRATLLLNEKDPPANRPPRSYGFDAPPRTQPGAPETSAALTFPTIGVEAGLYLVRVRVDGAESLLEVGPSGEYEGPEVEIP
jgi:Pvc16 N-terminal domain